MNDNTQPEALRLAEILEGDYCPDWFYEQGVDEVVAELRRQHTRIAELESELEAVGAGGVQALSAAPAGFVPVAAFDRLHAHAESLAARLLAASPTPTAEQQAAPKAAPGVGNSGFDHKTAADFLNGKTVSDEAVRKFVAASRWAHDERAALSATLLAMHGVLTSREAEIALLKKALLEAEAPLQQEAQEPVMIYHGRCTIDCGEHGHHDMEMLRMIPAGSKLYTAPQPAPAPLSEMPYEKRKAIQEGEQISASDAWFHARHNMLDTLDRRNVFRAGFDRGWNAAIAAQGGKDAE